MMKKEEQIENARAWSLIGRSLACGVYLADSLPLVEERCKNPQMRPLFRALISECERHGGARPEKTTEYDLIPDVVFELVYLGWASGHLDRLCLLAATWVRAAVVFENDPGFMAKLTKAALASNGSALDDAVSNDAAQSLDNCLMLLDQTHPIAESPEGGRWRATALKISNGSDPLSLVKLESLSNLERPFFLNGLNSGDLEQSLGCLADVIDFDHFLDQL